MEQERSESQTFQAKMLHDLPESLSVDRQQQNITAAQEKQLNRDRLCTVGICAMEKKVKSAAMQEMIHSILVYSNNLLRIIVFPLESIFNSSVEEWPVVDVLISFYSVGFPLDKVLQKFSLTEDLYFVDSASRKQELCACLAQVTWKKSTLEKSVQSLQNAQNFYQAGETIFVGSHTLHMPFVEKPACADRHDIYIYYPLSMGGGVRRLFRKTADRSSEYYIPREDEKCGDVAHVRLDGSYVYESFLEADIQQDVKVYCVGPHYAYGELRKSPVVDGVVERLSDGRERRIATILSTDESNAATAIVSGFRQFVCGFDIIRCKNRFFVIDVNGWSFVKGNEEYYRQAGRYLATHILFLWSKPNC
ncbi:Inositol hexakisphosphate and diphosphoinositol-pentakisphosphate kinase [Galdieria sulphuraria]|nr:Inositol hexakisphosphate and diphosphoinositol-pentakisphosphate kinase [Galdieria sulphuraria]